MKRFFTILLLCLFLVNTLFICDVSAAEVVAPEEIGKNEILAALWEADISSIHRAYEAKLITCTELTQYYLDRIAAYNETYNCFITLCEDALEQAGLKDAEIEAGQTGALLGIPIVIKDNMNLSGYHTTNGNVKRNSQIVDSNAMIVDYLLEAGAVIIGKTNMSTAAQDARASKSAAVGETKNAYSEFLASGGSSGGSASATSLNFAVAGLGSDTNSSLRLPAVLNGCVSLRSTWGTLSVEGIRKLHGLRDVPGVVTRTVEDQAIILDVISGGETTYAENLDKNALKGLRVGVLSEFVNRDAKKADEEVVEAFQNALEELKACGAEVVEVSIPGILSMATGTYGGGTYRMERMYQTIETAMTLNGVAVLVFPSYLNTPLRTGKDESGKTWHTSSQTFINNTSQFASCAGLPEIGITIGYHSLGAGIGMEIAALKGEEQLILDVAFSYASSYDHRQAPDNAPDLYSEYATGSLDEIVDRHYAAIEEAERLAQEQLELELQKELEVMLAEKEKAEDTISQNDEKTDLPIVLVGGAVAISATLIVVFVCRRKHRRSE